MKKSTGLILALLLVLAGTMSTFAQSATDWGTDKNLERVNTIGMKILSGNKLPNKIEFKVTDKDEVNAYADINNEIYVYTGLLKYVESDEELAAVISHEIGHIVNQHCQKQTMLGLLLSPITSVSKKTGLSNIMRGIGSLAMLDISRKDEYEADLTGADLMIGASYNPQGMISVLNKICGNYIDFISSHPSGDKRTVNIYDYVSYNYPAQLKTTYGTDSYKSFETYMNTVLKTRQESPKKMAEYEKAQNKLRNERLKKAASIQKGTNKWGTSYNVLQTTIQIMNTSSQQ